MEWHKFNNNDKKEIESDACRLENSVIFQNAQDVNFVDGCMYSYIPCGKQLVMKLFGQKLAFIDLKTKKIVLGYNLLEENPIKEVVYCFGIKMHFHQHLMFCCTETCNPADNTVFPKLIKYLYYLGSPRTILFSVPLMTLTHTDYIPYRCKYIKIVAGTAVSYIKKQEIHNYWITRTKVDDTNASQKYLLYDNKFDITPITTMTANASFADNQLVPTDKKILVQCIFSISGNNWIPLKKIKP